jgi:hypothetical protein
MPNKTDKPGPVRITSPDYVQNRTNHIRIQKDAAQRIVARYLREKMPPGDAIDFAKRICDGLISNMPAPGRTALRSFRLIPENPPEEACSRIAAAFRSINPQEPRDQRLARGIWDVVYKYGQALPDDVVA